MATTISRTFLRCSVLGRHRNRIRTLSTEAEPQQPSFEKQAAFLRAQDQMILQETQEQTDELIAYTRKIQEDVAKLPVSVQAISEIPPFTITTLWEKRNAVPQLAEAVIECLENIKGHVTDLKEEPYDVDAKPAKELLREEIARMSTAQQRETHANLSFEFEAEEKRLRRDSQSLLEIVEQVTAVTSKNGASVEAHDRTEDPFRADGDAEDAEDDEDDLLDRADAPPMELDLPLNPLVTAQRQLEESIYNRTVKGKK